MAPKGELEGNSPAAATTGSSGKTRPSTEPTPANTPASFPPQYSDSVSIDCPFVGNPVGNTPHDPSSNTWSPQSGGSGDEEDPEVKDKDGVEPLETEDTDRPSEALNEALNIMDLILTHDVEDFLDVVSQIDFMAEDQLLRDMRNAVNDAATELSNTTFISQAPTEGPDVLRNFQQYWITHMAQCGPLPTIEIRLENAFATVQALKPREGRRLDNMWTPITRRLHRCLCDVVHCNISIFRDFNAVFRPGEMTLLIGAPGSGKSTLLKLIAGRLAEESHWQVGGVMFNGKGVEELRFHPARYVALVDETDLHLPTMTVEETLKFAYRCNSPQGGDVEHVQTIMQILGLSHVAKTVVGDQTLRGCSGGERRRVTVGEAWAANVRVLLADRLTDGLDSQATLDIVRALRVWSHITSATVILALLQPPPEVYKYFDKVCILQRTVAVDGEEGPDVMDPNPLYCGPMRQAAIHMRLMGYEEDSRAGRRVMPITHSAGPVTPVHASSSEERVLDLDVDAGSPYKRPFFQHLWLLVKRQFRLEFFNRGLFISRILLNTVSGLATASIFQTDQNIQSALTIRTAILFHTCMTVVISVVAHIGLFGADRPVFYKQRGAYFFRSFSFWIAHNLFQLIFWGLLETLLLSVTTYWLGGLRKQGWRFVVFWMALYLLNLTSSIIFKVLAILCSTVSVAQAWAGLVQVIFFVFSGFLQPWPQMPSAWRWGRYISPQSYAFSILLINEFSDTVYHCTPEELVTYEGTCPYTRGDDWLKQTYDISSEGAVNNMGFQFFILIVWYVVYFLAGGVALHWVRWNRRIMHRLKAHTPESKRHHIAVPPEVVMSWCDVSYSVKTKQATKHLLHDISGIVKPANLTALMGPSGAGKTTLLDVLAGRKTGGTITGDIRVNGRPKEQRSFSRISGYVEQMNSHIEILTVLEALEFSSRLRLPDTVPRKKRVAFVETVMGMLGLSVVAHEQIADILMDQKKRLAVGVEVVSGPSILFLDEPTTGLDSMGAHVLMKALERLKVKMRMAIVCTIHQPSKDLFWMFDRLLLMAKGGHPVYEGELGERSSKLEAYLQGIPVVKSLRPGENPASWAMEQIGGGVAPDVVKADAIIKAWVGSRPYEELLAELQGAEQQQGEGLQEAGTYAAGVNRQLRVLLWRAFKIYWRSPSYNLVRTTLVVILALLLGTVFFQLQYNQQGVFSRLSWCYTSCFYMGLTFLLSGVTLLMPMRTAYYRERASNTYSAWAYGVTLFIAELPYVTMNSLLVLVISWFFAKLYYTGDSQDKQFMTFWQMALPLWTFLYFCTILGHMLSAISPTLEVANAIGPGLGSWFSSFAGFYLPRPYIPMGYIWIYWLNPFRYAYEALVLSQFQNRPISCEGYSQLNASGLPLCTWKTGNQVIDYMGMISWGYGLDVGVVFAYMAAGMVVTLMGLKSLRFGTT
eukprot:EG_transcript_419